MPYEETGAEKVKRKAYEKGNRERGIEQEAKRDYKLFGTAEQNIPEVNPMGDVVAPAAGMKKGGKVRGHGCEVRGKTKGTMVTMCGGGYAKGKK